MKRFVGITRRWARRGLYIGAAAAVGFAIMWRLLPPYEANLEDYGEGTQVLDRCGRPLRATLGGNDEVCRPIPVEETGDWIVPALVAAEDKRFFKHGGVDTLAIVRAAAQNLFSGRRVSGASTISTLVVKLTQPRPRTVWTKIVEAHHAVDLEQQRSKPEILEQFLNRAPFGANLRGIEAASQRYFGRHTRDLSLGEASLLAGLPQSPSRLRPDRHCDRAKKRRQYVLERMQACGFISGSEARRAAAQEPELTMRPQPFAAPHFCDMVLARYPRANALRTTLDSNLQDLAASTLERYVANLRHHDVYGAAIAIIDVPNGAVRALVGSPDFLDGVHAGQVNGATARRSPGSTLKPFVYALAIDQGMCTPGTMIADTPVRFRGYDPKNFNLRYRGPVTVREALVESLNIPAIRMTRRVGTENLLAVLRALGLTTLDQPAAHYGLSLVVGTCEVTLLELTDAYACLARGGVYRRARTLTTEPEGDTTRLFSTEAAFLVADMLSGDERAEAVTGHAVDAVLPKVAWKTGTSTGRRDAWTIAYNPEYVVGVWIGNPNGQPTDVLTGSHAAAPIAYDVFRQLYPDGRSPWFDRPDGLSRRRVCARGGCLPNDHCPATREDDYIPGITECRVCDLHRLNPATGSVEAHWPDEIAAFLVENGMAAADAAADRSEGHGARPRIVSPADGERFVLLPDAIHPQKILLRAQSGAAPLRLFWFVDGTQLAAIPSGQAVPWAPTPGEHVLACSDAAGHTDSVRVSVGGVP